MSEVWQRMAVTPWEVEDLDRWAERALSRGATALVLRLARPPALPGLWAWARRWAGVPWIVHARWATLPIGWGMHFAGPPLSEPPGEKPHPSYLWGQSCHSPEEVAVAATWASYAWIGPVFPTPSHPEQRSFAPLEWLSTLSRQYPTLPLVAIGGIENDKVVEAVRKAGAWGFAAIRYFG